MWCVVEGLIKPLRGFDWCNDRNPRLGPGAILIESLSGFWSGAILVESLSGFLGHPPVHAPQHGSISCPVSIMAWGRVYLYC